jgi:hypothetical protein
MDRQQVTLGRLSSVLSPGEIAVDAARCLLPGTAVYTPDGHLICGTYALAVCTDRRFIVIELAAWTGRIRHIAYDIPITYITETYIDDRCCLGITARLVITHRDSEPLAVDILRADIDQLMAAVVLQLGQAA